MRVVQLQPREQTPDPVLVAYLERALELARAGKVEAMIAMYGAVDVDTFVSTYFGRHVDQVAMANLLNHNTIAKFLEQS